MTSLWATHNFEREARSTEPTIFSESWVRKNSVSTGPQNFSKTQKITFPRISVSRQTEIHSVTVSHYTNTITITHRSILQPPVGHSCLSWAPRTELCRKLRPRYHFSGWFIAARGIRDMTVAGSLRCHLTRCGNLLCALMCAFVQRPSASMCVHVHLLIFVCACASLCASSNPTAWIKALCTIVHHQRQQTDCNWLESHSWAR